MNKSPNCIKCGKYNLFMVVNGDLWCPLCSLSDLPSITSDPPSIWKDPKSNFSVNTDWDDSTGKYE